MPWTAIARNTGDRLPFPYLLWLLLFFFVALFFVPSEDVCKRISSLKFLHYYFGMVSNDLVALCLSYVIPCLL